jgi:hypothetical protein
MPLTPERTGECLWDHLYGREHWDTSFVKHSSLGFPSVFRGTARPCFCEGCARCDCGAGVFADRLKVSRGSEFLYSTRGMQSTLTCDRVRALTVTCLLSGSKGIFIN